VVREVKSDTKVQKEGEKTREGGRMGRGEREEKDVEVNIIGGQG
jgi:hypothetical protein